MSKVNLPPQTTETNNSTATSWRAWGTTVVNTTWKRASRAYSISKNAAYIVGRFTSNKASAAKDQITILANTLFPKGLLVSTKDLAIRVSKEIYNTSTKTKVAAISLVALGYAYSQAPSFDDTMKRLIEEVMKDHPSSKSGECDSTYQTITSVAISSLVSSLITRNYYLPLLKQDLSVMNYILTGRVMTLEKTLNNYDDALTELQAGIVMTLEETLNNYHDALTELQAGMTNMQSQLNPDQPFIIRSPMPLRFRGLYTPDTSRLSTASD